MNIRHWKRRIRQMQSDELLERARQEILKRADAARRRVGVDFTKHDRAKTLSTRGKFFFAPESVDSILGLIRRRLPGRAEEVIQEANRICRRQFDLLGYAELDYGNSKDELIDWHCDAVHGKQSPRRPFFRVRYLEYDECGDSKVIWELNRHQHLVTLAKAFRLTGDLGYLSEALRQQRDWMSQNPYPIGINWASSLEVSLRCLSWLWTYHIVCGLSGVPDFRPEWLRGLALHGRHIERYLSTYFSPNTHLLGEAVGLFFLGVLCPELAPAQRWKALGWKLILQQCERQVWADGFHFEQSTYYHVYALDLFLHAQVLATMNGIHVPPEFGDKVEKMLSALSLLGRCGPPPRFGDDDGGRLFDPHRNRSEHLLDPLATGAVLFHRGDFKGGAGGLREETLWLLGEEGVRDWDRLQATPVEHESRVLPEAGYYMLTGQDTQLTMDAGPLGALSGGHGHSDALSICLQSHGRSLLIDPGTMEYAGAGQDRELFRSTAMHNTLAIDGLDQAGPATAFSWKKLTRTKVERWVQGNGFDLLVASHDGYETLEPPVTHRRCVISLKSGMYLVRDLVGGSGTHRIDISWHLGQDLERLSKTSFRVKGNPYTLSFLPAEKAGWTEELFEGWWSPAYGQKASGSILKYSARLEIPAEFAVLLVASNAALDGQESLRSSISAAVGVRVYEFLVNGRRYSFAFHDQGGRWQNGQLSSDAEFVCHELQPDFSERIILCGGTYAAVNGATLRCRRRVEWAELIVQKSGCQVFSSDPLAIIEQSSGEFLSDVASVFSH